MTIKDTFFTVISNLRYRLVALGGTTLSDGITSAGNVVAEIQQAAGEVEYADVFFNA